MPMGFLRHRPIFNLLCLLLIALGFLATPRESVAAIAYVQSNYNATFTSISSITATYTTAQSAGDLNVVAISWEGSAGSVQSITDSMGNTYAIAVGPTADSGTASETIYYAKNITAASANSNTITITFASAVPHPDLRIAEYSGISTSSPLDVTAGATSTGTSMSSGSATTTNANDLIVGANVVAHSTTGPGSGFTERQLTSHDDIFEDEIVSTTGSYSATAPQDTSGWYVMQMAAFKATATGGDTQPPTAPTGLGATVASSTLINLSWTASTDNVGVTGYRVERCQGASCSSFAQISSPTTTSYSDTGLTASTSYSYRVRATDAAGNLSSYSSTVSGTTQSAPDTTPPTAPTALGATVVSSSQVNLSWTASTDNVGVTGYRVERCQGASCTSFAQIGTPTTTSYSDTGLTASTSYSYRVRATDAAGNLSTYSSTVSGTTQAVVDTTPPTAPSGLSATATSSSQISLTWTASTDNVGVTGYLVERCQGASCTGFAQIATPAATSYSDSSLTASTSYSYRVRATDAAGNLSSYSGTASATTQAASSGLEAYWKFDENTGTTTADSSGNGNTGTIVSATWTTGEINSALSFNGTSAYVGASGSGSLADLYTTGMTVSAWIKPTGTSNAGRIVDKDNNGNGGWLFAMNGSNTVKFASDQFATTQPTRTSTTTITLNTWQLVTATWDGSTNGANIHVYINGVLADGASVNGSGAAGPDDTTPVTIGNRQVDSARGFIGAIDEVRIYNRILSSTEIAALADTTPPSTPTGLGDTVVSSSQINLSWTASTDNVGVTGYLVERCQGASCTTFAQIAPVTTTTYSDSSLSASTSYSYRVRATDAAGNLSGYSSTASGTTPAGSGGDTTPPTAPTSLGATAASSSQINLNWTASTDNVGVTGYLVERCQGASCSTFAQIATPTTTTYSDTALAASTSYSYRVRATDAAGNLSSYSSVASATTQTPADTTPPTAPSGLSPTVVSSVQINLSWTASTDNVGVTGYLIERCQGAGCASFTQVGTSITTTYSDPTLTAATSYSYRVRATDAAGNLSGYSSVVSATTGSGTNTFNYDANGHLKSIVTSTGTVYYHYDAAGNLTSVNSTP
jgi:YD repeat-containing protein